MARITIEDCMEQVPNRFKLVRMASIRAKQLKKGARPLLTSEENKHVVMSLREIAAGLVKPGETELPPVAEPTSTTAESAPPVAESAPPVAESAPPVAESAPPIAESAPPTAEAATAEVPPVEVPAAEDPSSVS